MELKNVKIMRVCVCKYDCAEIVDVEFWRRQDPGLQIEVKDLVVDHDDSR